jgi:hypothetical protein
MRIQIVQLSTRLRVGLFLAPLMCVFFIGCATQGMLRGSYFEKGDTIYSVGTLPDNWRRLSIRSADLAFENRSDGATLLINSLCTDEDLPLVALSNHLIIGMTEQEVSEQRTLEWDAREALETHLTAKLDGVKQRLITFVLKKNGCVYDLVLASPLATFDANAKVYETMRDQFHVGPKRL